MNSPNRENLPAHQADHQSLNKQILLLSLSYTFVIIDSYIVAGVIHIESKHCVLQGGKYSSLEI